MAENSAHRQGRLCDHRCDVLKDCVRVIIKVEGNKNIPREPFNSSRNFVHSSAEYGKVEYLDVMWSVKMHYSAMCCRFGRVIITSSRVGEYTNQLIKAGCRDPPAVHWEMF
jgi:hypothetical protein